ncbi:inosine-5-monophosphate dehydrogenase [candidate division MSBL1 archaeon SCGC-AAA382C18]|uniref:Inosine-5'-monophosphate dehydrogenase n=1 Tax=candidate division MSBL1 archaeon SCGC-AAA382C18 TaxID=1698281 RepID=A0A133VKX8_9EURY|nr:inosine-5-monophosphate dehydrogenase [candidate division MSBL1 archaeon SCGC-AAA382C18]
MEFETGLSFDDVLLVPGESSVLPGKADVSTRLTGRISLEKPILSSPMDRVTESELAIAMAVNGGLGVVHRNLGVEEQVEKVKRVKRSQSWIVRNPETVDPGTTVREARDVMNAREISGLPVVKGEKLQGIVTRRDLKFENDQQKTVEKVMTKEVIAASPATSLEQAKSVLHENRIEKLPLTDEKGHLTGLITVKDIEKKEAHPETTLDENGQLMVGAAVGPGQLDRVEELTDAGADLIAIDSAHGHSEDVIDATEEINGSFEVGLMSGNVATEGGAEDLADAGADVLRVGIGPGSICTTRLVSGIGVPQVTAIEDACKAVKDRDVTVVADGGIRYSGDITKALACGAGAVMLGNLLAGTDESPGRIVFRRGRKYKEYRGMGSVSAMEERKKNRYGQHPGKREKYVPEGVEGLVPYKGKVSEVLHQLVGGLRSGMGYIGAGSIQNIRKAKMIKVTEKGREESRPHDIRVTEDSPGYRGGSSG